MQYFHDIQLLELDEKKKLYATYHIARTLRLMEEYDSAIVLQKQLAEEFRSREMWIDEIDSYLELGLSFLKMEQWEQAEEHYLIINELLSNVSGDTKRYRSKILGSLGYIYMKYGEYQKSEDQFMKATPLMLEENDVLMLLRHYNNLGLLELEKGNKNQAISYFQKGIAYDTKHSNIKELDHAYNELIAIYESMGKTEEALAYSKQLNTIKAPFFELIEKLERLHSWYIAETVHYASKNHTLEKHFAASERRLKISNTLGITASVLLSLISIAMFIWFKKRERGYESTINVHREASKQYFRDKIH